MTQVLESTSCLISLADLWRVNLQQPETEIIVADGTMAHNIGEVKDLTVIIRGFEYHGDFVVMRVQDDAETTLILGRPFLRSCRATINFAEDYIEIWHGNLKKKLKMIR